VEEERQEKKKVENNSSKNRKGLRGRRETLTVAQRMNVTGEP